MAETSLTSQAGWLRKLPPNPNEGIIFEKERLREIVVAGGSFWGVEAFLARIPGVAKTEVGYANGVPKEPTLDDVLHGDLNFALAVKVTFDPKMISLGRLLDLFFTIIDPTALNHQGYDWGPAYRTGVYFTNMADVPEITEAFERLRARIPQRIMVEFEPLRTWYPAEAGQQQYLEKHPEAYCSVTFNTLPQFQESK